MSAGPRRSGRVADMNAAAARGNSRVRDDGYKLSTELTKKSKDLIARNDQEYVTYPINSEDWIVFFCDFFDYIQNNIDTCLSKIKGLSHITIDDLNKVNLSSGGFDDELDDFSKFNYNIGLYEALFTQFRDGTNKINNCTRLNQLLSYIGAAVLRMSAHYNKTSANALIEFYRKIATILEISVYPEVFLHYMTGDSTGNTNRVDLNFHGQAKANFYNAIWIRKQEFLGVITSEGKNYWKKYDNGLRLFVRNYIRRLITYMRTYNATYPLGYELPYNYSVNPKDIIKTPLPFDGVYKYSDPPENYYISREDWNYIPNIFLPDNCPWSSIDKDYINPEKWRHPPPKWWIDRTIELFEDTEWWRVKDSVVEAISTRIRGTVKHKKWMALNCILPQQIDSYSEIWDAEYDDVYADEFEAGMDDDEYMGYGGISKMKTNKQKRPSQKFKIIQDKDRAIHPNIQAELKSKLKEYFKLNVVVVGKSASKSSKDIQSHLRDDTYIDNLCNYSMLYNANSMRGQHKQHKQHKINKNNANSASTKARGHTV
jgi:hypothetical protein